MLLERVTRALAPDYEILQEVAAGGMGIVYAARQRRLDRKVAVKILRPEHATAVAVERFLAEGRVLARLSHPNIVPVYDAGEADGLLYYVMEYVEGETLAERLTRGPLPPEAALALTRDLLAALNAAHGLGVVHRDIKPANIFLREGHALLGDFGIARWREAQGREFTTPGEVIGTPRYMSPEQRDGLPATTRTDVYAAGLAIWEASSGVRWPYYQDPEKADWTRVPPALAAPLRRALALEPAARWDNAAAFAAAIGSSRRVSPRILALAVVLLLGLGFAGYRVLAGHPRPPGAGLTVAVERFSGVSPTLGDSIAEAIRDQLRAPDFNVLPAGQLGDSTTLRLNGSVIHSGNRLSFRLEERQVAGGKGTPLVLPMRESAPQDWPAAADTLSADLMEQIWEREDQFLPTGALPKTTQGRRLFFTAERYWSRAQWEAANTAYGDAERADPSCALCAFRLLDIARWLGTEHDTAHLHRVVREQNRFSPLYQALIHAMGTPLPTRLDTLLSAAKTWPKFHLASFTLGDELFHRGALYGRPRRDAAEPFHRTVRLAPWFEPGWEHLAFFLIVQGDSAGADTALTMLGSAAPGSGFSAAFRTLLRLGFAWRFLDSTSARQETRAALGSQSIRGNTEVAGGARLLVMLDAPRGAVELGRMLSGLGDPGFRRGGLLGRLTGWAALGGLDSLRATGALLHREGYQPEALLALELEVVLRCFDPDPLLCADPGLVRALQARLSSQPSSTSAAWALGLLAVRSRQPALAAIARRALAGAPPALVAALDAAERLAAGDAAGARQRLPTLPPLEDEGSYDDPLLDAVVRLLRSEAALRQQHAPESADVLLWQEHVQLSGHLSGDPQAGEMAWALGTLLRWRRAALLETVDPGTVEHCSLYLGVARLWHGAPAPFGARADSAAAAARRLGCVA